MLQNDNLFLKYIPENIGKDNSAKRIGERIKKIREFRGLSRAELGERVGLDQNRVQQYENGIRKPKIELLKLFASALGVSPLSLLDPTFDTPVNAMYAFFELEEKYGVKIDKKDDGYYLKLSKDMDYFVSPWHKKRTELEDMWFNWSEEEREQKLREYNNWEWNYSKE